jgi:hypothetical protein
VGVFIFWPDGVKEWRDVNELSRDELRLLIEEGVEGIVLLDEPDSESTRQRIREVLSQ